MPPYHNPDVLPRLLPESLDLSPSTRLGVGGVLSGIDAVLLAEIHARQPTRPPYRHIVHIAINDAGLDAMHIALQAIGIPPATIALMPAWDCLPYDRASPNATLVGRRIATLTRLAQAKSGQGHSPSIILTTANAWLQRLPPHAHFAATHWQLARGDKLARDKLTAYANSHGYRATATVREAGEYAMRGSLIDIFPPAATAPVRLDLFGDTIDSIKQFDADTQQSTAACPSLTLTPASELPLDATSITRFRRHYIAAFGGHASQDWLYECTSQGLRPAGLDQYLPLFYDETAHLTDYVTQPIVVTSTEAETAISERFEQISDFYTARQARLTEKPSAATSDEETAILRPLPGTALYLSDEEHGKRLDETALITTTQFKSSIKNPTQSIDIKAKKGLAIYDAKLIQKTASTTLDPAHDDSLGRLGYVLDHYKHNNPNASLVIAANSGGSLARVVTRLADMGVAIHETANLAQCQPRQINGLVWRNCSGFVLGDVVLISEEDIYGRRHASPRRVGKHRAEGFLREVSSLTQSDLVVHTDHGIGRYDGLHTLTIQGAAHDCLKLSYAEGDILYVPVENIDVLSRYGKGEGSSHPLDRLGSAHWQARKARIKNRIRAIAEGLIKTAALRATTAMPATIPDPAAFSEFCRHFPYAETDDQLQAIADVLGDMASGQAMDRLVCGDVGFGKTEVALRAAFVSAQAGYQVAVVTPTTLLARQHSQVFASRFAGFGISVKTLSRMTSSKDATATKKALASGACNIVIGTHAVLAKSLQFRNLGLVVIDEEQRFGVAQKERLKQLRGDVHVLTLTATPIPRTLQMALSGVRDMSIIATPPIDRLAIRTWVGEWDRVVLANALRYECHRGGQIFCVSPRIDYLPRVYDRLRSLAPDSRIITAHGKLPPGELDQAMQGFADGEADILLATNIIESGIDIQRANTMVVHRADLFGLGQLYQLRGRIGRGKQRAHAYLTTEGMAGLSDDAKRRFEVMQTLDSLGAGFTLASYDLDMRGGGNLLGDEQSGHIQEVGVELYQSMLAAAVKQAKRARRKSGEAGGDNTADELNPLINLGAPVLIPESYVADLAVRLSLYRRIAAIASHDEQDKLTAELIDRFGTLPPEVHNLMEVMLIKLLCRQCRVVRLDAGPKGISMQFKNNRFPKPDALFAMIANKANGMSATPQQKLVIAKPIPKTQRIKQARAALEILAGLLAGDE